MFEYNDYNEDTLKHLQNLQLSILKDFAKICEENNLTYFAYGGTSIGAIRHKGFIPWDDDVDVIMFRDDYEKFLRIMESRNDSKYYLVNMENTEDYFFYFSKLCLKGTNLKEDWTRKTSFDIGINIDIFILDYMPDNAMKRKIFLKASKLFSSGLAVFLVNLNKNYPSTFKKIIAKTMEGVLKILRIDSNKYKKLLKRFTTRYQNTNYAYDVVALLYQTPFHKDILLPPKEVPFEDTTINVPNDYDQFLTMIYGDYMKIPPVEERYNHVHEGIDFGDY